MDDLKNKVDAASEELKESFKEGAKSFLDDVADSKHTFDELNDEHKAENEAKKAARKEKFEGLLAAVLDSFKQGVEEFKSDAAFTKDTVDEFNAEHKEERAARKAEKKEKFESTVADLKNAIDETTAEQKASGLALLDKMKDAAKDAGIDVTENETISNMFKAVKESFAEGIEELKSDASFTKDTIEELNAEHKADRAARKAEIKEQFNETVGELKDSFDKGADAMKADAENTKATIEELNAEHKAEKVVKEAAKRADFDEKIESLKDKIDQ